MSLSIYGIDLAKHSFSIHGEDANGNTLIHKTISRAKLLTFFANLPPAIVGMEACGSSHYWARELTKLGHTAKIMASKYVAPFRTGAKNDLNDVVAICVAVTRPSKTQGRKVQKYGCLVYLFLIITNGTSGFINKQ